ncbi:MAG: hypothetical protein CME62_05440 [Halobacteriovoraceae bacterium]|nr:hypothetical protein [Halobacteriovoraceae bacterium]|tara:strand:+ start:6357 stop:8150 length:1794 start_codon:yes stop_codon:yes gene_type:complete
MKLLQQVDFELLKEKFVENKLYLSVWILTLLTIIMVNSMTSSSHKFVGETDSKEVNITSRHPVVIKGINVIPGQYVKQGELLVQLERKDLEKSINEVTYRLDELRAQYKLNSELNANIKSMRNYKRSQGTNEDEDLLSIQIKNLEKELKLLKTDQAEQYIFSNFDGHIGFVNFKVGELVSPFTPILTLHKKTPSFVRGYIHENLSNQVAEGKKVYVKSLSSKQSVVARVKSVGTRIVEFPERFRRTPEIKVWGREVMIEIPHKNSFLLGEKVFIDVEEGNNISFLNQSVAKETNPKSFSYEIIEIKPGELSENNIEPSGVLFVKELNKFMFISDDNYDHKPLVYLLNRDGTIDPHIITVEGLKEIKDMEAITQDEKGNIYISSSQSESKNGKLSKLRQKLIQLERKGVQLISKKEVNLFNLLDDLADKYSKDEWVKLVKKKKGKHNIEIDVEGLVVYENTAYLGLRNDVGDNNEVSILQINHLDRMFEKGKLSRRQVSIFRTYKLPVNRKTDRHEGISDLLLHKKDLYIVTGNNKYKNRGRVLKTSFDYQSPVVELKNYSDHRPEGITFDATQNEFLVVFDNNDQDAPLVMSTIKLE